MLNGQINGNYGPFGKQTAHLGAKVFVSDTFF